MLASNACRKADSRLDQNIEALAKSLPVLLPLSAAYFSDDFSATDAKQLHLKLSRYLGSNPYDQAAELKGELSGPAINIRVCMQDKTASKAESIFCALLSSIGKNQKQLSKPVCPISKETTRPLARSIY